LPDPGLRRVEAAQPSPVHGLSSIVGADPCQAPPVKPTAAGGRLRPVYWLRFCASDIKARLPGLQVVLCCLVQRAVVQFPPLLMSAPLPRPLHSPVVLHGHVIAALAEPRSPQRVPLQSRQQSPPWRLRPPCSGSLLCTPTAGRCCCRPALRRWLRLGAPLLVARIAAGYISAALAAVVGGCLLLELCVQRLQALPHRRRHVNNGYIRTASCTNRSTLTAGEMLLRDGNFSKHARARAVSHYLMLSRFCMVWWCKINSCNLVYCMAAE
jgi:hypothetical protein